MTDRVFDSADEVVVEIDRLLKLKAAKWPESASSILEMYASKCEAFDHMLAVAKANGFESLTEAIAVAKQSRNKPCLHTRLNIDTCEDCGAKFELRAE